MMSDRSLSDIDDALSCVSLNSQSQATTPRLRLKLSKHFLKTSQNILPHQKQNSTLSNSSTKSLGSDETNMRDLFEG